MNATTNLLEAGYSNREVKSITGRSTDWMINWYGKKANQRFPTSEALDKVVKLDRSAHENG